MNRGARQRSVPWQSGSSTASHAQKQGSCATHTFTCMPIPFSPAQQLAEPLLHSPAISRRNLLDRHTAPLLCQEPRCPGLASQRIQLCLQQLYCFPPQHKLLDCSPPGLCGCQRSCLPVPLRARACRQKVNVNTYRRQQLASVCVHMHTTGVGWGRCT